MEIFVGAVDLKPAEAAAYLDQACGADAALRERLERLVAAHHAAGGFIEKLPLEAVHSAVLPPDNDPVHIGPYRVLSRLGEGGFGIVYLAEQTEPVRRRVALKLIKAGMDSAQVVARFGAERQALALMDHPSIARVFDAGTTDPSMGARPYFAMEYVAGEPITTYCDRHSRTIRQRLELFVQVCRAIQHAHTKGVIHRDIKPSNILVWSPEGGGDTAKVIDFGIAKALHQGLSERTLFTAPGQMVGTPEYMSPEQAEAGPLDVDTRSDVYSLGVLLYELLTGVRPFDLKKAALAEVARIIREQDAARPSTRVSGLGEEATAIAQRRRTTSHGLARELGRELEWIPLRALRKDRTERYQSAADLAADVESYLAGRALRAGPESALYRARKFLRRNRRAAVAGGIVALGLIVGVAGLAVGMRRAEASARRELERAREASQQRDIAIGFRRLMIEDVLGPVAPTIARGQVVTVRATLEAAADRIVDSEVAQTPEVRATMASELSGLLLEIGDIGRARRLLDLACSEVPLRFGESSVEYARTLLHLASLRVTEADYPRCLDAADRSLAILSQDDESSRPMRAQLERLAAMATFHVDNGAAERALVRSSRGVAAIEHAGDQYPFVYAESLGTHAQLQILTGNVTGAAQTIANYSSLLEKLGVGDHPARAAFLEIRGFFERRITQDHHAALAYFEQAAALNERLFAPGHPGLLNSLDALAMAYGKVGDRPSEIRVRRQQVDIVLADSSMEPATVSATLLALVEELLHDGALVEAEDLSRRAYLALTIEQPANFRAVAAHAWATCLRRLGRYEDAQRLLREALALPEPDRAFVTTDRLAKDFVQLYDAWEVASPSQGHADRAAAWRAWRAGMPLPPP